MTGGFLIWDSRGPNVADLALWWKPNGAGYTTNLDEAGRYTQEEADARSLPKTQVLVPVAEAYRLAGRMVRHEALQHLAPRAGWSVSL